MHSRTIKRVTAALSALAVATAVGAPVAPARVPDDSVARTVPAGVPDMHASTALAAAAARQRQDLRSADARDAAAGRGTFSAPDVMVVKVREESPRVSPSSGLDWSDAGIGAGGVLTLILLATGGAFAAVHHRRGGQPTPTV